MRREQIAVVAAAISISKQPSNSRVAAAAVLVLTALLGEEYQAAEMAVQSTSLSAANC